MTKSPPKTKRPPMELPWRNKTYRYKTNFIKHHADTRLDIEMPICGADTESTRRYGTGVQEIDEPKNGMGPKLPDIYECQCVTYATPKREGIRWVQPGENALMILLEELLIDTRPEEDHKKTFFVYIHNLGYDIGQLFKWRPDLMDFARAGAYQHGKIKSKTKKRGETKSEYYMEHIQGHDVYLKNNGLFTGTAPHFTFRCYRTRKDYTDISFLDTGTYFRGTLSKIGEQLNIPVAKQERQLDLGKRDYRFEQESPDKDYFIKYSVIDAVLVKNVGEKIVELHKEAGFTKLRVSSPGFAHSFFCKQLGELNTVIFSGSLHQPDMALMVEAYAGGRTGGLRHGAMPEGSMYVYDFASSYPAAMLSLPSFGPKMKYRRLKGTELKWANVWGWIEDHPFCFLRIDGEETDKEYPALISEQDGKLTPVYGKFEGLATTGPEVYGGIKSGTLKITKVHEAVFLVDQEDVQSPFRKFAQEAYENKKKATKDSIQYILAKLLLNSAYGKWIQSTKKQYIGMDADDFICMFPKGEEDTFAKIYLEEYAKAHQEGRDVYEALEEVTEQVLNVIEENNLEQEFKPLEKMDMAKKEFAPSAIPGAASLVTGIARARLRALIKCTGAIYWDTDSAFILHMPAEKIVPLLKIGSGWLHPDLVPLRLGKELGEIDLELSEGSGYLAGTKRYFFKSVDKVKVATHGISNLYSHKHKSSIKSRYAEAIIRSLALGKDSRYKSKGSPLKLKGTEDARVGLFVQSSIAPQFHLDERLIWQWDAREKVYKGNVKPWQEAKAQ